MIIYLYLTSGHLSAVYPYLATGICQFPFNRRGRVTHICVIKDGISGCGPSPYLNQYWLIVSCILVKMYKRNLNQNTTIFIQENKLKMSSAKWQTFCLGLNVLNCALTRIIHELHDDYKSTQETAEWSYIELWYSLVCNDVTNKLDPHHLGPLLLTWFNFNPSMDK